MTEPGHDGLTEMEWLEREQEKEMIELALERSLNEFNYQHNSVSGCLDHETAGGRMDVNFNNSMPAIPSTYSTPARSFRQQHRGNNSWRIPERDAIGGDSQQSLNNSFHGTSSVPHSPAVPPAGTPSSKRNVRPVELYRTPSNREMEWTETVIDSPHQIRPRTSGGSSASVPAMPIPPHANNTTTEKSSRGRDAVLETARQHLSETEARLVEEALRLAERGRSGSIVSGPSNNYAMSSSSGHSGRSSAADHLPIIPPTHATRTQSAATSAATSTGGTATSDNSDSKAVQRGPQHGIADESAHRSSSTGGSSHSNTMPSSSLRRPVEEENLTEEEMRQLEEALRISRLEGQPQQSSQPKPPSHDLSPEATMELLHRASHSDHFSRHEIAEIERAMNIDDQCRRYQGTPNQHKDSQDRRPHDDDRSGERYPRREDASRERYSSRESDSRDRYPSRETESRERYPSREVDPRERYPRREGDPSEGYPRDPRERDYRYQENRPDQRAFDRHDPHNEYPDGRSTSWDDRNGERSPPGREQQHPFVPDTTGSQDRDFSRQFDARGASPRDRDQDIWRDGGNSNPNRTATATHQRPQRSASGESLARTREEIQNALSTNTLSPQEVEEIMAALEAPVSRNPDAPLVRSASMSSCDRSHRSHHMRQHSNSRYARSTSFDSHHPIPIADQSFRGHGGGPLMDPRYRMNNSLGGSDSRLGFDPMQGRPPVHMHDAPWMDSADKYPGERNIPDDGIQQNNGTGHGTYQQKGDMPDHIVSPSTRTPDGHPQAHNQKDNDLPHDGVGQRSNEDPAIHEARRRTGPSSDVPRSRSHSLPIVASTPDGSCREHNRSVQPSRTEEQQIDPDEEEDDFHALDSDIPVHVQCSNDDVRSSWATSLGRQQSVSSLGDSTIHSFVSSHWRQSHQNHAPPSIRDQDIHHNEADPHPHPGNIREEPSWRQVDGQGARPENQSGADDDNFDEDLRRAIMESMETNSPHPDALVDTNGDWQQFDDVRQQDTNNWTSDERNRGQDISTRDDAREPRGSAEFQAPRLAEDNALERALREAKDEEERQSLLLAHQLQQEDERLARAARNHVESSRNISEAGVPQIGAHASSSPPRRRHPLEDELDQSNQTALRSNLVSPSQSGQVGAHASSSPPHRRHPREAQVDQSTGARVGAHASSNPSLRRHPLEDDIGGGQGRESSLRSSYRSSSDAAQAGIHGFEARHVSGLSSAQRKPHSEGAFAQSARTSLSPERLGYATEAAYGQSSRRGYGERDNDQGLSSPGISVSPGEVASRRRASDSATPTSAGGMASSPPAEPHAGRRNSVDAAAIKGGSSTSPRGVVSSPDQKQKDQRARDGKALGPMARLGNKTATLMQAVKRTSMRSLVSSSTYQDAADVLVAVVEEVIDAETRVHIDRAINRGIILKCNGVARAGKEATIFHADKGPESNGYDVAIKVFKRARGLDTGQDLTQFHNMSEKEQLEMWTNKEYRNLKRAKRAGVYCPAPLFSKENVLFMQFIGYDGQPAPKLKEVDLRRGHKRWRTFYKQTIESIHRLFHSAQLVHGHLSESNILVVPRHFFGDLAVHNISSKDLEEQQLVFIDFGQTVDRRHPDAVDLMRRDLGRIRQFFLKQGVRTPTVEDALEFIVSTSNLTVSPGLKVEETPPRGL